MTEVKITVEFKSKKNQKVVLNEVEARELFDKLKSIYEPVHWTYYHGSATYDPKPIFSYNTAGKPIDNITLTV